MKAMKKNDIKETTITSTPANDAYSLETSIAGSWSKVAPFWPLKNMIAVNPISGFEDLSFEEGVKQAQAYFQQKDLPEGMQHVNRESIKWLQTFFDEGQSTIHMPQRHLGFLESTLSLIKFDEQIHSNDKQKLQWLKKLNQKPEKTIAEALLHLGIPAKEQELFLTLMLTTLPGWAAHIQYRTNWADAQDAANPHSITQSEYLAFRLILTYLIWPEARELIIWHQNGLNKADVKNTYDDMTAIEASYQDSLLKHLMEVKLPEKVDRPQAQFVFCIDVRSEPFRRALEAQGNYETYGFAGFFGLPVAIENVVTGESHASCPVLLKPSQTIIEHPSCSHHACKEGHSRLKGLKKVYQSVKYTFTTPFSLVEAMGLGNGIWMGLRSCAPNIASKIQSVLKNTIATSYDLTPDIQAIPHEQQVTYGMNALKMMGLTENFAPLVVFCGHRSTTQNNAYAKALDCGACGGRHSAPNARIMAAILNNENVRQALAKQDISIPKETLFVAAEHNTTTDEVEIYAAGFDDEKAKQVEALKQDLLKAREENTLWRAHEMDVKTKKSQVQKVIAQRAQDWAQVRPEWGLARNASFIVAPRSLTKNINLEGRSFLHSYEWEKDEDGSYLTTIFTAPMVVAQWINAQYLFSTLDNVAFGGGSKITKNITGKIGVMQGNASDLMHGLPLQSVFKSDEESYHKPIRLTVIVYAPKRHIDPIIKQHTILQKLFGNGWIHLICYDPEEKQNFSLQRDLTWFQ
ncbi:MAG: DUF2309 domain-containing protein [Chlamydiota bacterium]